VGVRGLSIVIGILALPAYLEYFKNQQVLGVWFALLSILNWVLTFDLGIGNGLRNYLVKAFVENDEKEAKRYISSAYISIGSLALLIGLVGYVIIEKVNWNYILNISEELIEKKILAGVVGLIYGGILLQFCLRLILSILYALQKPALSNFISFLSNLLILSFLIFYKNENDSDSLKAIAIFYVLAINIPLLIATLVVFAKPLKNARPSLAYFHKDYSRKIIKLGSMFLGIQLSLLVINATNQILIIRLYQPVDVVVYQAYFKIYSVFPILCSLVTIPMWSAITKAHNEKRYDWIRKAYKYLTIISLCLTIIGLSLTFAFQGIINIWLGDKAFKVDILNTALFAVYNSILVFIYCASCVANGMSKIKPQMICLALAALFKIPLVVLSSKVIDSWVNIIIVNIIILLPCLIIQPVIIWRELKGCVLSQNSEVVEVTH